MIRVDVFRRPTHLSFSPAPWQFKHTSGMPGFILLYVLCWHRNDNVCTYSISVLYLYKPPRVLPPFTTRFKIGLITGH